VDQFDPAQWAPALDQVGAMIVPTGAALAAVLIGLLWWQVRRRSLAKVGRAVTTPLVLLWEAQGLHHLAVISGAKGVAAWVLAGVTSAVLITLAAYADDHHKKHGNLGWPGRLVWIVAVPMGFVVALTAATTAEFALRIVLPLLVAVVWWIPYAPDVVKRAAAAGESVRKSGAFRLSPRRILVWAGLVDPTDADLSVVHEERQIRRLTTAAHKLHHGWPLWKPFRAARLRRLGLVATPTMVEEVARRVRLVHDIERLTSPVAGDNAHAPSAPGARADSEPAGPGTRADDPALTTGTRADDSAPTTGTRAEPTEPVPGASARPAPRPKPARAKTAGGSTDSAEPAAAGARSGAARAEISARAEAAYAQYTAWVEKNGSEPDGSTVAGWIGYRNAANGRKAREPWRVRIAQEIASGARARPANLPGEVAALLPPETRARVPEQSAPTPAREPKVAEPTGDDILGALALDAVEVTAGPAKDAQSPVPVATA